MDYIRVDGFTDNQIKHADILWALQSQEEVEFYLKGLSGKDFTDCQVALMMLAAESFDEVMDFEFDLTQVLEDLK
jgi:hypothetical protein